jgi:hypothetical protein
MDCFKNQEVYLVVDDVFEDEELTKIFVTENRMELDEYLISRDPSIDDVRVMHGVLTGAKTLPASFKGKSVFTIIIPSSEESSQYNQDYKGIMIETSETPGELAQDIETLIAAGGLTTSANGEEVVISDLTIDNIYILYGYQVGLGLAIIEDDIDEECICTCQTIADDISEMELENVEN